MDSCVFPHLTNGLICAMLRNKHGIDQHVTFAQVNTIMHAFDVYVYATLFAVG